MTAKHVFFINAIIVFILSTKTTCNLTSRTKYYEETTEDYEKNFSKNNLQYFDNETQVKIENKKLDISENANRDESKVYLDDVIIALKSNNWNDEEKPCIEKVFLLLNGLQNFTLWAVWNWDAQASEPQGLLFGNRYQLGNFDQCMNSPWSHTHPELNMKYCLADIKLERTDKHARNPVYQPFSPYASTLDYIEHHEPHTRALNELMWGSCVPTSCLPQTIEKLIAVMLARSHLGAAGINPTISVTEPCQAENQQLEFDGLFYAFMSVAGLLGAITLICTYLNSKEKGNMFIKAFCLKENANGLLKVREDGIQIFYGIKFLTMCLIVLDHYVAMNNMGSISNGKSIDKITQSIVGLLLLHDDLFVDTFFLIAGFLTMVNFCQIQKLPNPLFIILKRYIRLVAGFAAVTFYMCAVFPYTGSGPLWNRAIHGEVVPCRKNWWLNILMIHNYVDTDNMCMVTTWYIPCDFHYLVMNVLLFWVYKQKPILGKFLMGAVIIASFILPGIITYVYGLSAIQSFTVDFSMSPRASKDFMWFYIKSHTRSASYVIGAISGFIFAKHSHKIKRISKERSILGVILALIFMLGIMISGSTFIWRDYHPIEGAIYAALNRPAWALGVTLFVLCCTFGDVPLVKGFLSWYPWVPLSRLVYGLYLIHVIFIMRNTLVARNPHHSDYMDSLTTTAGIIFWSCVAALILWLLVEAPANKLLALCLRSKFHKPSEVYLSKPQEQFKNRNSTRASSIEQVNANNSSRTYLSKL